MPKAATANRPTHKIFAVRKSGDKSQWTEIGAAWTNQDGKGFKLLIHFFPMDGADIVMREPKDDADAKGGAQ